MIKSVRLLTFVQLCNFFGINEVRFSKDPKKKKQIWLMVFVYLYLGVLLALYTTSLCSSLIVNGMTDMIPTIIAVTVSSMMLAFTVFRAGPILFNMKSYESMVSLPVKTEAIVISRFISLYTFDVIYSIVITLTCAVACGMFTEVSPMFYISMILGGFFLPLIPMTVAMVIGTAVYALTSRMKKRSFGGILRTALLLIFMIVYMFVINNLGGNLDEAASSVAGSMASVSDYYLPAQWFGNGANGNLLYLMLFILISLVIFFVAVFLVGRNFISISTALASNSTKSNYVLKSQKGNTAFAALFKRELKRYFASSVYVSNTMTGFIFAVLSAIILAFSTGEALFAMLPLEEKVIMRLIPFIIALLCNLSPTTTSAISMEGKTWSITKSLPVSAKDLMNSKLSVNLVFAVPSLIISIAVLAFGLEYTFADAVLSLAVTLLITLFVTVLCLYMNVKMPDFSWENEAVPVKQSKCVMIAMLISFTASVVSIVLTVLGNGSVWVMGLITILFALATVFVYNSLVRIDLYSIN